ncbi:MAG: cell division protein ZapA [Thermoflexibacter sp.]|jgi:cell division protein ZapA|nr:cell division protein ZapA [Thermoflexibacter sp.]
MGLLSVKINIADREYTLKVEEEDAPLVLQASEVLNQSIRDKKEQMRIPDRQDLLSMVAFDCIYEKLTGEKLLSNISHRIALMESVIGDSL